MKGKLFRYCLCLSLPILWMGVSTGYAQTGPSTVTAGASEYYTYSTDVYMTSPNWQAVGGTVVSEDHMGFDHSVTVEWGAPGSGSIALYDGTSYQFALLNVTINCPTVSNPSTTFGYTNNCGNTVITRNSVSRDSIQANPRGRCPRRQGHARDCDSLRSSCDPNPVCEHFGIHGQEA